MMRIKSFGLVVMLMSATACAPVVYDGAYYKHRSPAGHASVSSTYRPAFHSNHAYQSIHPIEVTLYADNSYLGAYFRPISIIIADGDYVEIPVKNRRGRHSKIFAHYHQQNLHFDSSRDCQRIHGSTAFNADQSWNKGHKYRHLNAGIDYDLTGLRMQVRDIPFASRQPGKVPPKKSLNNAAIIKRTPVNQTVRQAPLRPTVNNKVVHHQLHSSYTDQVKTQNKSNAIHHNNSQKVFQTNGKVMSRSDWKATKPIARPHVVQKVVKHNKPIPASDRSTRVNATKPDVTGMVESKRHKGTVKMNQRNGEEAQKVERAEKGESLRRGAAEERQITARTKRQHHSGEKTVSKKDHENMIAKVSRERVVSNENSKDKSYRYGDN